MNYSEKQQKCVFFNPLPIYICGRKKDGYVDNLFIDIGHCWSGDAAALRKDSDCQGRWFFQQACRSEQGDAQEGHLLRSDAGPYGPGEEVISLK